MLELLVNLQGAIHSAIGAHVSEFAQTGDCGRLVSVVPAGIAFGALHALTPGHNKLMLAVYAAGNQPAPVWTIAISGLMTLTHIGSAVLLAIAGSALVSRTLVGAGRVPALEAASHALLIGIGLWLVARSVWPAWHDHARGAVFGVVAGLIPCPLTLFVMVFALAHSVPEAGLVFAGTMVLGVGAVLVLTGLVSAWLSGRLMNFLVRRKDAIGRAGRIAQGVAGVVLLALAISQVMS
ncbi:MAG: nickel/cobalt transporter [Devosia indica]